MLKILLAIFVIAKILGLIDWSWWIVLSPLFASALLLLICGYIKLNL